MNSSFVNGASPGPTNSDTVPDLVVMIPTTQVDSWLEQSVNSVLAQVGVSFRILVIHDGVAPDPAQPWMSDARVSTIHFSKNVGLAAGLREAISASRETFIARLDADDFALPGRLKAQRDYLVSNPDAVLVATQPLRVDEFGIPGKPLESPIADDVRSTLIRRNTIFHPTVMFRREACLQAGGFDSRLRVMEDYDMWLRMATIGKLAVLPMQGTAYRIHSAQMSRGAKPNGIHIRKIASSHRMMAKKLGVNPIYAGVHRAVWISAQYFRYWGIRTSRLDR